jgi:hypothetical protein
MAEELFLLSQPMELPIATMVGATITLESLSVLWVSVMENIKIQRENYGEFCEDEQELNDTLGPIEEKPEPYSNGTIKTRPILKKYAMSLCEKLDLDLRIEIAEEALRDVDLSPQQVKADMKHYVAICEKKIASQKELCEQLQEQVKQLTDVVKCIVTHPIFDSDFAKDALRTTNNHAQAILIPNREPISLLTYSIKKDMPNVQDFLLEQGLQCDGKIKLSHNGSDKTNRLLSSLHYAVYKNDMTSVQKMLSTGSNINGKSILLDDTIDYDYRTRTTCHGAGPFKEETLVSVLEIACKNGSLEMVKFLHEKGATIGDTQYHVPNGTEGDLVAGYLQTHGSKPVIRF